MDYDNSDHQELEKGDLSRLPQHTQNYNADLDVTTDGASGGPPNTNDQQQTSDWIPARRYTDREIFIRDLYNSGYDQEPSAPRELNHVPFADWSVRPPAEQNEKISDLRLFTAISLLFSPVFGTGALIQAFRAQNEAKKGNITRAKELNSTALGLAIAGIAISLFLGAAMGVQQFLLNK